MLFSQQVSVASKTNGMNVLGGTSPNAAVFGNALYAFYMGSGKDGVWYTTTADGQSWSPIQSVRQKTPGMNTLSNTSPNAAVLGNTLYLFYNGSGGDGIWYTTTTDGESWSPVLSVRQKVPAMNVMGDTSPNAVVLGGTLYLFYNGSGKDGIWYTTTVDGQSWSSVQSVRKQAPGMNVMNGSSPTAVVLGSTLYLFYNGSGGDGIWYTTTVDGQSWTPVVSVRQRSPWMNVLGATSAGVVVTDGTLYLFYMGSGKDGIWYTTTADGQSWTPARSMANDMVQGEHGALNGTSAWAVEFGSLPYVLWNGAGGDGIFYTAEACYPLAVTNADTFMENVKGLQDFVITADESSIVYLKQALISLPGNTPAAVGGPGVSGDVTITGGTSQAGQGSPFLDLMSNGSGLVGGGSGGDGGSGNRTTSTERMFLAGVLAATVLYAMSKGFSIDIDFLGLKIKFNAPAPQGS
ncbi:MAG: hypothetical protein AB1941_11650 [Gemmatimonadota bacterium]